MLVSIIIAAYNAEHTLKKCVDSIIQQTYKDIEIIIVDDGSTDNTQRISKELQKCDQRILYKYQDNNGVSSARNAGIELSSGKLLAFCDSDDFVSETYIESMYNSMQATNSDWVLAGFCRKIKNNEYIYDNPFNKQIICTDMEFFAGEWYKNSYIPTVWAALYKADIIKKNGINFPLDVQHGEDTIFNIYYYIYCEKVSFVNIPIYTYIEQPASLTKILRRDIWQNQEIIFHAFACMCKNKGYSIDVKNKFFIRGIALSLNHAALHSWSKDEWRSLCQQIKNNGTYKNLSLPYNQLDGFAAVVLYLTKTNNDMLLYYLFHLKKIISIYLSSLYYLLRR